MLEGVATITESTCNERCWKAKEIKCRCACGGKNHGILLVAGAEQPVRMSRRKGIVYELAAIVDGYGEARRYTFARGVFHSKDARMIMETAGSRKWPEVINSGAKRPYLIWIDPDAEIVDPLVCKVCGREEQAAYIDENGVHSTPFRCRMTA